MLMSRLKSHLTGFARREDGTIAIEAMIVLPAMFWTFLVCFSIFDTFRMYSINQRAIYTVGDAISRETVPIDADYLSGAREMFEYLSASTDRVSLRVSALRFDAEDDRFYANWSQTSGSKLPLTGTEVAGLKTRLPTMPDNEVVVLVESWTTYDPPFRTGMEQREITNFSYTSPRFAPQICWEACPD